MGLLDAVGGVLNTVGGFASGIGSLAGAGLNYASQQANLAYTKEVQQKTWDREDNAVQRRVADLQAAGLSKTLAAGSAAQSSAPIRTEAPQIDTNAVSGGISQISSMAQAVLNLQAQKAQIDKTTEENNLIRLQQDKQRLENAFMTASNPLSLQNLQMEVNFARASNPQRLARLDAENQGIGIENKNKQLDGQLKALGITQADLDIIGARINNEAKSIGLDLARKDVIVKQLAIEQAGVELENSKFAKHWYSDIHDLPVGFQLGVAAAPAALAHQINGIIDNLFKR